MKKNGYGLKFVFKCSITVKIGLLLIENHAAYLRWNTVMLLYTAYFRVKTLLLKIFNSMFQ